MGGLIMEQFSLEKYLENPSRHVVTRDGRPVRIICTDSDARGGQIVAIVTMPNKKKQVIQFYENGRYYFSSDSKSEDDLFFAPTIVKRWGIVYRKAERLFDTREEAEKWMEEADEGEKEFCSICKVEWEEK